MAKISFWLESEGFEIVSTARARRWIAFNATAGQIRSALRTEIHRYRVDGELHFANQSAPQVPAAIQDMVLGFGKRLFRRRGIESGNAHYIRRL
jgi:subtilase family serine protease